MDGSNRTIVGLKQLMLRVQFWLCKQQQSHHCGIETQCFTLMEMNFATAAIAPLWD